MKNIRLTTLAVLTAAAIAGSAYAADGTFRGTAMGHNDEVIVDVTIEKDRITDIKIVQTFETPAVAEKPLAWIPETVVKNQSLKVDRVSGATFSSLAILGAVRDAVKKAGLDPAQFMKGDTIRYVVKVPTEPKADVVIVGGGGAGMSAAVAAARAGGKVVVLEKMSFLGGNTVLAGGALNAADPKLQGKQKMSEGQRKMVEDLLAEKPRNELHAKLIEQAKKEWKDWLAKSPDVLFDTPTLHALQTWKAGDYAAKLELVAELARIAPGQVDRLEKMGLEWNPYTTQYVGAIWPRSHDAKNFKSGIGYINTFRATIEKEKLPVEILYQTKAEKLIVKDGRVVGVEATGPNGEKVTASASKGVILTTGGFGANPEMRMKYDTQWGGKLGPDVKTTNSPAITGDGMRMAEAVGANLIDMGFIQLLPTTDPANGSITTAVAEGTSMYVNKEGKRFVNELERRDVLSRAALAQPDGVFYRITTVKNAKVDENGITAQGQSIKSLLKAKKVYEAPTIEELAKKVGMDPKVLGETVAKWNDFCRKQTVDPDFGRASCTPNVTLYEGPYYAEMRAPAVHHTMGGVEVDAQTRVLDKNGKVIPGLYAAGEVTGGLHGTNRVGGNAIPDALGNGQKAGEIVMGVAR